jgi:hypothetical protein
MFVGVTSHETNYFRIEIKMKSGANAVASSLLCASQGFGGLLNQLLQGIFRANLN